MPTATVPQAFVDQFSGDVRYAYQQQSSRLRQFVMEDSLAAQYGYYEYINPIDSQQRTERFAELTPNGGDHYVRRCSLSPWVAPVWSDRFDQAMTKISLASSYSSAVAMALGRRLDTQIVNAALGTAYQGRGTSSPVTLPSGQIVAVNYFDTGTIANTNLTLDKVRMGLELLRGAEAVEDPSGNPTITVAYTANQEHSILKIASQLGLSEFSSRVIATGQFVLYGINWVRINSALIPNNASGYRQVVMFAKDAVQFCTGTEGLGVEINYIPTRLSWLINGKLLGDASRMRETGVAVLLCDETKM